MKNLAIIGCGHWGKNYLRVFREICKDAVITVYDADSSKLESLKNRYYQLRTANDLNEIMSNREIEAVVISTPANTHYELIKNFLLNNKHVLVEKPFTLNSTQAREVIKLSEEKHRILMVSHTFLYNPAVRQIKEYIDGGECGKIYYLKAIRTHLGLIREDVNAFWDLAPHDISIFNYLLQSLPVMVSATGIQILKQGREDAGFATLIYPGNIMGNIHVSWIDSHKEREVSIVASKKRITFNDLDNLEKIRIFEKGIEVNREVSNYGEFQLLLRDGNIVSPKVTADEPLRKQCEHFLECVKQNTKPLTDGYNGLEVVRVLEALEKSLARSGEPVKL